MRSTSVRPAALGRTLLAAVRLSLAAIVAPGCSDSRGAIAPGPDGGVRDPGALIKASLTSQVGVVLDEIPAGLRGAIVANLEARDPSFWIARAKAQVAFTRYRLA